MFLGVTCATLLTLLPKNDNMDCFCLLSMFSFVVFGVLFVVISLRVYAMPKKASLIRLSAFVCQQQLSEHIYLSSHTATSVIFSHSSISQTCSYIYVYESVSLVTFDFTDKTINKVTIIYAYDHC